MLLVGRQEVHPACKKYGGMVDTPSVSPDGVAPSQMVSMSTSVTLPLHHKVQKFSFGIGSPRWSQKKDRKSVVVCWWVNRLQKSIPFWILLKQEMMGWQWQQLDHMQIICTSRQTDNYPSTSPLSFCSPDALPAAQPTVSKHWRHLWLCCTTFMINIFVVWFDCK